MTRNRWIIFCLAYICGLWLANLGIDGGYGGNWLYLILVAVGTTTLALAIALVSSHLTQTRSPKGWFWLSAAIVTILAVVYFQLRLPQAGVNDISYSVAEKNQVVTVAGKVLTEPRLTASHKLKFWLASQRVDRDSVSGKLYVTVPLLQGTGIYPGELLQVRGILYLPPAAKNPGGFDFQAYLARQGTFAALKGLEVIVDSDRSSSWGWWQLRRRILRSHLQGLGSPRGQLVSSMVLGRRAVDLSRELGDRFIEAGLAHTLAASGFHVSLLLGIILKLTKNLTGKLQLILGLGTLLTYIGLTGLQPSVFRAGLMGAAVLVAIALETKVKPLGSLLLAATILLLFNPLWIGDLGFQLSFLATLGLIVTLPTLQQKLDWLPPGISSLIAVPIAASVWVLPLLSYVFNTVALYSIPLNIICTPLIVVISLGGMISALAALIFPAVGSAIAFILFYPTALLIYLVNLFTSLPGNTVAIGQISLATVLIVYALLIAVWLNKWFKNHWQLVSLVAIALITIPNVYNRFNLLRVDILAVQPQPVIVIQDRGKVILIDSGDNNTARYTVLPFLATQGINHIDYGVAFNVKSDLTTPWSQMGDRRPLKSFPPTKTTSVNTEPQIVTHSIKIWLDAQDSRLKLQIQDRTWLILGQGAVNTPELAEYIRQHHLDHQLFILLWSGDSAIANWLNLLHPQVAIATNYPVDNEILSLLQQKNIVFYHLQQEGAISWTANDSIKLTSLQREFADYNM
ncbi:MAG: ComEC/Rec2 family competence protein [Pleurocapsa sp.]